MATLLVTYGGAVLVGVPSVKELRAVGGRLLRTPIFYAACAGLALRQSPLVVPDEVWRPVNLLAAERFP